MFAQRLKELRIQKNLDQKDLANALGVLDATISMWETGKRVPYHELLIKIANYFNVSTDYLLGNEHKISSFEKELNELEIIKKYLVNIGYMNEKETLTNKELDKILHFIKINKTFIKH